VPAYELRVAGSVERKLSRLPEFAAAAIVEFVTGSLVENPHRVGKPLVLDLAGYHCARRGAYRVIYRIDESQRAVLVVRIDHRADVYRGG
jgi:mRNA-degrading endonuclease RelE of RelBE toxin-antitoxin system